MSTLSPPSPEDSYLLITPGGIGDAILFSPVIDGLACLGDRCRIEMIVSQRSVALIACQWAGVSKCHLIHTNGPTWMKTAEMLRFARIVRNGNFSAAVIAAGCHPIWGMVTRYLGGVRNVVRSNGGDAEVIADFDRHARTVMAIKPGAYLPRVLFPIDESKRVEAETIAADHGVRLDIASFGAIYLSRASKPGRLPPASFLSIIRRLKEKFAGMIFIMLGDEIEAREWAAVDSQRETVNLGGVLSIAACGEIFRRSLFAICNDGGLMHVAAAVGCPLFAVLGDTKLRYLPAGRSVRMVVSSRTDEIEKFAVRYPYIRWRSRFEVDEVVALINSESGDE